MSSSLRRLRVKSAVAVTVVLVTAAVLCSANGRRQVASVATTSAMISFDGNTMGGTWSVKLTRPPANKKLEELRSAVRALLAEIEGQMSTYRDESDVCRFNRYRGVDWVQVPQYLANVVAEAQRVSEKTDGALDVTVGPLVDLWGFGPAARGLRAGRIPDIREIAGAMKQVGWHRLHVRLSPPALRKDDVEIAIDLSAIAKGYAAGCVAKLLDEAGVCDYLIAVGGEVRGRGEVSAGRAWRVGIEVPTPDVRRVLLQIELRDGAVSTSGDYRNFFEVAGRRYCHEIDPRTGRPIEHGLACVSVAHPISAEADAFATALMVLGPEQGYDAARRLKLAALFVTSGKGRFETRMTPEFERLMIDGNSFHDRPWRE